MTPERWQQIKAIFQAAVDLPTAQREAYAWEICGNDAELRREVESLLAAHFQAQGFIESPAVEPKLLAELHDDVDPMVGRRLGPYRVEKPIGRGGMGTVYVASRADQEYEKSVAIKMVSRGMDTHLVLRRFRSERQILANLDHPNIARLIDGGTTEEGLPYFVMEYVEGEPIGAYCDRRRLSTNQRLGLFREVCAAVEYAHRKRVVHRDIKPGNILVTSDNGPGALKLLDFGIARIFNSELGSSGSTVTIASRMMTPAYASPEQVRGEPATAASDIYSLGVLLYELLTGHRPYPSKAQTPDEMAQQICDEMPERPSVAVNRTEVIPENDGTETRLTPELVSLARDVSPKQLRRELSGALDDVILKALRKEPDKRYRSVAEFSEDIGRYLDKRPVGASRGTLTYRVGRTLRSVLGTVLTLRRRDQLRTSRRAATDVPPSKTLAKGPEAARVAPARRSLAILGFKNLSNKPDVAWLSTALSEMFTTEVAVGGQLRAIPTENVSRLRASTPSADADSSDKNALFRLGKTLGSDLLVFGSYLVSGTGENRQLRLDLRVMESADGENVVNVAECGPEADLFGLVSLAGRRLREQLGVSEASTKDLRGARAAFPSDREAARLYAEGLEKLRVFDAIGAKSLLEEAVRLEPSHPMTHSAVSAAWSRLGYDAKSADEARTAFDLSENLSREDRLSIEGRYREAQREWDKASEVYRTLWSYFSDNIEYGLRLVSTQVASGKGKDALATVESLRRLPALLSQDARIDYAEGEAAGAVSDFKREQRSYAIAAQKAKSQGAKLLVAAALQREGRAHFNIGNHEEACDALEESRRLFAEAGDRGSETRSLTSLATVHSDRGDLAGAIRAYREALATSREIGDKRGMSIALNNLGIELKDQGQFAEAREMHEAALDLRREIGDKAWTAVSLVNIGVVLFEQDHFNDSAEHYQQALEISREIGDRRNIARALHNLSIVRREQGLLPEAKRGLSESLGIRQEIGDHRGEAIACVELAHVLHYEGDLAAAKSMADQAVRVSRQVVLKSGEAQGTFILGDVALSEGDLGAARNYHEAALAMRTEMNERRTIFESRLAFTALSLEEGHLEEAAAMARQITQDARREGIRPAATVGEVLLARTQLALRNATEASEAISRAKGLSPETQRNAIRNEINIYAARVEAAAGNVSAGLRLLARVIDESARNGATYFEFEARLATGEILMNSGEVAAGREALSLLESDALRKRFGLIARKARQAAGEV